MKKNKNQSLEEISKEIRTFAHVLLDKIENADADYHLQAACISLVEASFHLSKHTNGEGD